MAPAAQPAAILRRCKRTPCAMAPPPGRGQAGAVRSLWISPRSKSPDLADSEQAVGPDDQHHDDQQEHSGLRPRDAVKHLDEGFEDAQDKPRDQGPADAAEAAEYRDDQGLDHRVEARVRAEKEEG